MKRDWFAFFTGKEQSTLSSQSGDGMKKPFNYRAWPKWARVHFYKVDGKETTREDPDCVRAIVYVGTAHVSFNMPSQSGNLEMHRQSLIEAYKKGRRHHAKHMARLLNQDQH